MRIAVISLGCAKNTVDSEKLMGRLALAGHQLTGNIGEADAIFVNTCAFIESARQESIDTILESARDRKKGAKLYVTGCLSQKYPVELMEGIDEIDGLLGVSDYDKAVALLSEAGRPVHTTGDELFPENPRFITDQSRHCYVKIAEGCFHRCAFCTIPSIRGKYHSRGEDEILAEVRDLAAKGMRDFTLVAQDTSSYYLDVVKKPMLASLMRKIRKIEGVDWLRALYCYPETVTDDLIEAIAEGENKYIDMPLQHISAHILKDMRRPNTPEQIYAILEKLRSVGITTRTTLMVGFPGETEADFEELISFVRQAKFDRMGAFAFCPEEGTRAAEMENQIDEDVKQERLNALMSVQQEISMEKNAALVGTEQKIIIDTFEDGYYVGRTARHAPEVDGNVYAKLDDAKMGDFVNVNITRADAYDLYAE